MVYKRILVPFDDSVPAKNALKEAVEIAKQNKGTISLLYVIQEIVLPPYSARESMSKPMKEYEKEIYYESKERTNRLFEKAKKNYKNHDVDIKTEILYGNTAEKILNFIKSNKMDLVVIGTTSRTGLSKLIALGSVARKISEQSSCPVLLVH